MAPSGPAKIARGCLLIAANRTTSAQGEFFGFDPNVWSGRVVATADIDADDRDRWIEYARIANVRRSKTPVARVARQPAYSPLVANLRDPAVEACRKVHPCGVDLSAALDHAQLGRVSVSVNISIRPVAIARAVVGVAAVAARSHSCNRGNIRSYSSDRRSTSAHSRPLHRLPALQPQ